MELGVKDRRWFQDPLIWVGALLGVIAHAFVFFAGEYMPYMDWSNHIGLISVLAHGGESGASLYYERSLAPSPYLVFYALTATIAQLSSVVAAAKISLLIATALSTLGAAALAEACDRSPRLGLAAPLILFGHSLGYGFASYVFTMPLILWVLAYAERLLATFDALDPAHRAQKKRPALIFSALLALTFLSHGLAFAIVCFLLFVRIAIFAIARLRYGLRSAIAPVGWVLCSTVPALLLGLSSLAILKMRPERATETTPLHARKIFQFTPLEQRLNALGNHLLERGSAEHWITMKAAVVIFVLILIYSAFKRRPRRSMMFGLEIHALVLALLWSVGPDWIGVPFVIWGVASRMATLAALMIFMLPRAKLSDLRGGALAALGLGLVFHGAHVNAGHVRNLNKLATQYDPVRKLVPKKSRYIAVWKHAPGDPMSGQGALRTLYFYHLADGAAYSAFTFDNPLTPVRNIKERKLPTPHWGRPWHFNPKAEGRSYDHVIARGKQVIERIRKAGIHQEIGRANGWVVFENKTPPPWPNAR